MLVVAQSPLSSPHVGFILTWHRIAGPPSLFLPECGQWSFNTDSSGSPQDCCLGGGEQGLGEKMVTKEKDWLSSCGNQVRLKLGGRAGVDRHWDTVLCLRGLVRTYWC